MRLLLLFIKIVDRLLEFVGIPGAENDFIEITVNRAPPKNIFEGYCQALEYVRFSYEVYRKEHFFGRVINIITDDALVGNVAALAHEKLLFIGT